MLLFTLFNYSSLIYIGLSAIANLPNITSIFHDFPGQTIKFHDRLQAWKLKLFMNINCFDHNKRIKRNLFIFFFSTENVLWLKYVAKREKN